MLSRLPIPALFAGLALCGLAGAASAQPRDLRGEGTLELDARYAAADGPPALRHVASVGLDARALIGPKFPLLYGVGLGYRLGGGAPAGFLYRVELLPLGAGLLLGESVTVAAYAGGGLSGVTAREPFAWTFPLEARAEINAGDHLRLALRARTDWVRGAAARKHGSEHAPFGDELETALLVRLGHTFYQYDRRFFAGSGYYLGLLYDERMGGRFYGLAFGHGIDAGMP